MENNNYPQAKLDLSEIFEYANSIENPCEKLRYLRQYIPLLAVYAEHEPFQVEELIAEMPEKFREEVWGIYADKLELVGSKSDPNTSVEQKIDINIITEFTAQTEKPKVTSKQKEEEVKFQEPKKDDPVREKQKSKRTNQLHELIEKVYLTLLESNEIRPSASEVWNELMTNEKKYDVDEIIQEVVKFKAIYWISKDDKVQEMKWSTFKKQLSIIRSK